MRVILVILCCTIIFTPSACAMYAQKLYSQSDMLDVRSFWKTEVARVMEESIKPSLNGEQLRIANKITFDFSTDSDTLIGFGALGTRIILPIQSWTLLQDLVVAYVWQDINNCRPTVMAYSNLLKYRAAASLPGGRFPDPIEAMGIPSPNTAKLAELNREFATRFERVFYAILLFVTAHEVGHVVLGHSTPGSVEKEIAADDFAFSILAKQQIDPSGVMIFFVLVAPLLPTDDELTAMNRRVDHPLSGRRIHALGLRLVEHPDYYYPGAKSSDPRTTMLKGIGARLVKIGDDLDSLSKQKELRKLALDTNLLQLRTCPH